MEARCATPEEVHSVEHIQSVYLPSINHRRPSIRTFPARINHKSICRDEGLFKDHRGIDPKYPRGRYCCPAAYQCSASGGDLYIPLSTKDVEAKIYLRCGVLFALLSEADTCLLQHEIKLYCGDEEPIVAIENLNVFDFKSKREIIDDRITFIPLVDMWQVEISLFNRSNSSDMSLNTESNINIQDQWLHYNVPSLIDNRYHQKYPSPLSMHFPPSRPYFEDQPNVPLVQALHTPLSKKAFHPMNMIYNASRGVGIPYTVCRDKAFDTDVCHDDATINASSSSSFISSYMRQGLTITPISRPQVELPQPYRSIRYNLISDCNIQPVAKESILTRVNQMDDRFEISLCKVNLQHYFQALSQEDSYNYNGNASWNEGSDIQECAMMVKQNTSDHTASSDNMSENNNKRKLEDTSGSRMVIRKRSNASVNKRNLHHHPPHLNGPYDQGRGQGRGQGSGCSTTASGNLVTLKSSPFYYSTPLGGKRSVEAGIGKHASNGVSVLPGEDSVQTKQFSHLQISSH